MNQKLTGLYVSAQQRIARMSDDRGQGALEYIGILAIVVLVVGFAMAGFKTQEGPIGEQIGKVVTDIMNGGGS